MSDSDKTNELDNFGVWVKKPPRTVSSEIGEENTDTLSDIDNDLPQFSAIDVADTPAGDFSADETALSADELANISGFGSFDEASPEPEPASDSSGETEISLDEFIDGGVFEGDDGAAPSAASEPSASESTESPVSEPSDITVSDAPSISDAPALSDDGPIDIDLSFDDSDSAPQAGGSSVSSAPVADVPGSEEIDLSDFGVDFGDDGGSSSPASESTASADGTEEVDLSDFGVDFGDDSGSSGTASESTAAESDDGTEEVSLDSFGFDPDAGSGEAQPAESDSEQEAAADSSEMTVMADDDVGDIAIDTPQPSNSEDNELPPHDFATEDNDDFNLDSIMDSIQDENGNTTSLSDVPESTAEEESDIPDSPDVVDLEEPVFEETAVDVPEPAESEAENPFALPPDDAFAATTAEEPTMHDGADEGEPVPSAEDETESAATESIASENEAFPTEPETESPIQGDEAEQNQAEQTNMEEEFVPPATEAQPQPNAAATSTDAEISAATSNILSQIASELSSLRSEISNLKNDFEELKNKGSAPVPAEPEMPPAPEAQESAAESSGGFFGDEDGDDTIALSLDEMDNILNSVELVEEDAPAQEAAQEESEEVSAETESETVPEESPLSEPVIEDEPASDAESEESLDFSTERIEEPVLDDIDTDIAEEELPEEILVPKTDELVVEPSDENLIGEEPSETEPLEEETEELSFGEPAAESATDDDIAFDVDSTVQDDATEIKEEDSTAPIDEPFVFDEAEESPSEAESEESLSEAEPLVPSDENSEADAPLADDDDTTLSADELANIARDLAPSEKTEEEALSEETIPDTEAESSIPSVSDILGDTDTEPGEEESAVSITEGELDNLLSSEAALTDSHIKYLEEEEKEPVQSSIPSNLQKEIKSVLSYMDQLLENLPEEKIAEFAQSEQFETYKKLFKELGLD